MYKVIGGPRSRLTRVTWMLQELGEDYKIVPAKPRSEEILKYNPAGKGPVLVDGDLNVIDVVAIPKRLEDRVVESKAEQVLNRLFSEVVIDPVNLILMQRSM